MVVRFAKSQLRLIGFELGLARPLTINILHLPAESSASKNLVNDTRSSPQIAKGNKFKIVRTSSNQLYLWLTI